MVQPIRATFDLSIKTRNQEEEIFWRFSIMMIGHFYYQWDGTSCSESTCPFSQCVFSQEEQIPGQEAYSAKIIPDRGAWLELL